MAGRNNDEWAHIPGGKWGAMLGMVVPVVAAVVVLDRLGKHAPEHLPPDPKEVERQKAIYQHLAEEEEARVRAWHEQKERREQQRRSAWEREHGEPWSPEAKARSLARRAESEAEWMRSYADSLAEEED